MCECRKHNFQGLCLADRDIKNKGITCSLFQLAPITDTLPTEFLSPITDTLSVEPLPPITDF